MNIKDEIKKFDLYVSELEKKPASTTLNYVVLISDLKAIRKIINKLMELVGLQRDILEEIDRAIGGHDWIICKQIRAVSEKSKQLLEGE